MSWSFNNLPYGWKIATGITLSAITIFVADNVRQRINQADEIELDLAVAERCLATQYSTNPVSYYVTPPQYVRSWYSNAYVSTVTNGVTNWTAVLHTNVFTNAVGYRTDRAKAVARDATIKALVPYYCDPDTVYDGTTNIVMLTVTGLWASLQIGDKTNLFTREPEWIGTNGVTNAATYGELPWRIYKTDLEERYKVLNALKVVNIETLVNKYQFEGKAQYSFYDWTNTSWEVFTDSAPNYLYSDATDAGAVRELHSAWYIMVRLRAKYQINAWFSTNIPIKELSSYLRLSKYRPHPGLDLLRFFTTGDTNCPGVENEYINIGTLSAPTVIDFPYQNSVYFGNSEEEVPDKSPPLESWQTCGWSLGNQKTFIEFVFQYCTNKYW